MLRRIRLWALLVVRGSRAGGGEGGGEKRSGRILMHRCVAGFCMGTSRCHRGNTRALQPLLPEHENKGGSREYASEQRSGRWLRTGASPALRRCVLFVLRLTRCHGTRSVPSARQIARPRYGREHNKTWTCSPDGRCSFPLRSYGTKLGASSSIPDATQLEMYKNGLDYCFYRFCSPGRGAVAR